MKFDDATDAADAFFLDEDMALVSLCFFVSRRFSVLSSTLLDDFFSFLRAFFF